MSRNVTIALVLFLLPILLLSQNNAALFDGLDDYAAPLSTNSANITEGTIEMWFKPASWPTSNVAFSGGNGHPGVNGDLLRIGSHTSAGSGPLAFGFFGSAWVWSNTQTTPDLDQWLHIAVTWGSGGMKVYLNGDLKVTNGTTWTSPNYAQELIAADAWGGFFKGQIDELRIWNKSRNEADIKNTLIDSLPSNYYSTTDSGLIAYYRFDEISEFDTGDPIIDVFEDLSVNQNHAEIFDTVQIVESDAFNTFDPVLVAFYPFNGNSNDESGHENHGINTGATLTTDRFGNDSSAYHFDGTTSYIDIGNHPTLKMEDAVTIAAWVNIDLPLTGGSGFYNVISDHNGNQNNGKIFRFQGNAIEFLMDGEGTEEAQYTFPETTSGWQHIAATYDGDSIKVFVNGIHEADTSRPGTIIVNTNNLLIGKSAWGEHFPGDIDDLRIYHGALSLAEIKQLVDYTSNKFPGLSADSSTVALYKFENDSSTKITDHSGNNNHATNMETTILSGPFGNARSFIGEQSIEMDASRLALQGATEWSLEFVAKSLDSTYTPGLVNHMAGNGWVLQPTGSTIAFGVKTTSTGNNWISGSWANASVSRIDTSWHYYAMTYIANDSLRVYKDGQFVGGYGVFGQFSGTAFPNKAYMGYSDSGSGYYYNGIIDEVRVSSVARSSSSIQNSAENLGLKKISTLIADQKINSPLKFTLEQNFPNPFNPITTIKYSLEKSSKVKLTIYDLTGRQIKSLVNGQQSAGFHKVVLDASSFTSGIYIYKLKTNSFEQSRKMILIK